MNKCISILAAVVVCSGCASSQDALVKRRDEIRATNAADQNVDVAKFQSKEGVRGATWGMTMDQVVALKGDPAERMDQALMYLDAIDGQQAPTTYVFFDGHLAQVKSRFEPELQASDRLIQALGLKWGEPLSDFDKAKAKKEAMDSARRWDLINLAIGATFATVGAAGGHGPVHGLGYYPLGFTAEGSRSLIEAQMANEERPARDVLWATHESSVHFIALSSGLSEITWSSQQLGRRLVRQQMSRAGLENLADAL